MKRKISQLADKYRDSIIKMQSFNELFNSSRDLHNQSKGLEDDEAGCLIAAAVELANKPVNCGRNDNFLAALDENYKLIQQNRELMYQVQELKNFIQ